eukprot:1301422-Pleurochrysis_carterae.AAC.1
MACISPVSDPHADDFFCNEKIVRRFLRWLGSDVPARPRVVMLSTLAFTSAVFARRGLRVGTRDTCPVVLVGIVNPRLPLVGMASYSDLPFGTAVRARFRINNLRQPTQHNSRVSTARNRHL